ncbi:MAG: uracil-DNA glycosylase family protein [Pseudomonadota bacterium]
MKQNVVFFLFFFGTGLGCGSVEEGLELGSVGGKADGDSAQSAKYAGNQKEYDPGPPGPWTELFAQVPNYRKISRELGAGWLEENSGVSKLDQINRERDARGLGPIPEYTLTKDKFRYEMGPIFYRGRLDGSAKVLVVGQDAATDEALAHRTFVGGTGQKVQNWLNEIGMLKSYVCLNTFVYSIFEQYDEFAEELATTGLIKDYRNRLFDKVFSENDIKVILSVGNAAHESVQIFVNERLNGNLPSGILWVKVMHPGAVGIDQSAFWKVAWSFTTAWKKVWDRKTKNPNWLVSDIGGLQRRSDKHYYRNADIPFRDLPYGVSPELGRGGTKSERAGSGQRVEFRSENGMRYEAPDAKSPYQPSKWYSGFIAQEGELAWEPAKRDPQNQDSGPSPSWVELFDSAMEPTPVKSDFRRPIWYRGRLDGSARVLVIAQDYGVDQLIAGRALVGDAGQKINELLANIGIGNEYVMLNVIPFSLYGMREAEISEASLNTEEKRNGVIRKVLERNDVDIVLTFGVLAKDAFESVQNGFEGKVFNLEYPCDNSDVVTNWNENLNELCRAIGKREKCDPYSGRYLRRKMIPREDLPWGVPLWFGSGGDLSQQPHQSWLFWNVPWWVKYETVD